MPAGQPNADHQINSHGISWEPEQQQLGNNSHFGTIGLTPLLMVTQLSQDLGGKCFDFATCWPEHFVPLKRAYLKLNINTFGKKKQTNTLSITSGSKENCVQLVTM